MGQAIMIMNDNHLFEAVKKSPMSWIKYMISGGAATNFICKVSLDTNIERANAYVRMKEIDNFFQSWKKNYINWFRTKIVCWLIWLTSYD